MPRYTLAPMPQICGRAGRFGRQFLKLGRQFLKLGRQIFEVGRLENSPDGQVAGSFFKLAGWKIFQPVKMTIYMGNHRAIKNDLENYSKSTQVDIWEILNQYITTVN